MKKSIIIYTVLIAVLILVPVTFISLYTINKELRYTILDAVYEESGIIKQTAMLYLGNTARIHSEQAYPYTLLSFTLNNYNQAGTDKNAVLGLVTLLVNRGLDINGYNAKGTTVLHEAVLMNRPDLVRFLVERGADLAKPIVDPGESRVNNLTPLQLAEWLQTHSSERGDWSETIALLRQYDSQ